MQAELKKRGVNIDGEEDELRSVLLSVVSIELGLSQKALGDVATSLIDRVGLSTRIVTDSLNADNSS